MGGRGWWTCALLAAACSSGEGGGGDDSDGPDVGASTSAGPPGASATGVEPSTATSTTTGGLTEGATDEGGSSSGTAEDDASGGIEGCQDGNLDPGEACDDGNDVNGDGCNRDCRFSGQLTWELTVGSGYGQVDQGFAVFPDDDGGALVGGYLAADEAGARDGWLARYDASGSLRWEVTLTGPGGGNDEIRAAVGDGSGSFYAAGYISGPKGQGLDAWVARYDETGVEQWVHTYDGPDSRTDVYDALVLDADGNLILGGYSQSATSSNDVFLRKLDPAGAVLWSRVFPGPSGGSDILWDVDVSPAGHIFAAGYEGGPAGEGRNAWLGKFDTDGNEIWSRSFNGPASLDDQLIGLAAVDEDEVVVSGYHTASSIPWELLVRRYDSLGMIVWTDRYAGGTSEGAHAFGMTVDPEDGKLVVTGSEIVAGVRNVLVRKYSPEGQESWTSIVPGGAGGPDYGRDAAVASDGSVWVVGALDSGADARDVWLGRFTP